MKLTDKQAVFIEEYLRCWNAAEAARRAGYSARSARQIASENLTKPDIRQEIDKRLTLMTMSVNEVLARLTAHARGTIEPFLKINKDGFMIDLRGAEDYLYLIKKLKTKRSRRVEGRGKNREVWEDEIVEIELHDAQKALEMLGKHWKIFSDGVEEGAMPILVFSREKYDKVYGNK